MRNGRPYLSDSRCTLLVAVLIVAWFSPALGQSPSTPSPSTPPNPPAASPEGESKEQLAERVRKMEEMNQRLLRQFESISKQNEALSKQVQDLSKRLDDSVTGRGGDRVRDVSRRTADESDQPTDESAPSMSESAARPSRVPGGGTVGTGAGDGTPRIPAGGGTGGRADESAPSMSESAARPSRVPGGGSKTGDRLKLNSFYDQTRYGYVIQSEDQEFELRFNGLLQVDARVYANQHQSPVTNDIDIPRMRLYFSGRMTKPIEYQLSIQRSTNNFDLLNAWINFHYDDRFQVRFGRFKPPFTNEWYKLSSWEFSAPERSLFALNFGPNRQVGLMGWGFLFKERLEYAVGIFDGQRNSTQDFNNPKDVMALLDYKPFYPTDSAWKNLGVGGSLDVGNENNPAVPAVLRTSTNASGNTLSSTSGDNLISVPFLAFNNDVRERGRRALWELHATYFYKGLSLLGAWDSGHNDFSRTTPGARPVHLPVAGYYLQAAYLLTGETRQRPGLVAPIHPFDIRRGKFGLGAWEVQARFSELTLGNQVFTQGLADPNLWTNRVDMVDVGFNWYLNKFTKIYFDWEHAIFGQPVFDRPGPGLQKTSDLFWIRCQIYL